MIQDQLSLTDVIEAKFKAIGGEEDRDMLLVRYVLIVEFVRDGETRSISWAARDRADEGLWPWETMGLLEYMRARFGFGEVTE